MDERCCHKIKKRSEEERRKLVNRLSRIEGQIRGVRGMVEQDAYCTDVLTQASAVRAALDAFMRELLSEHIRTCVTDDLRSGKEETAEELIETLKRMM
ncbi:MAG: metal-sensing transcriptional repressor [Ruminococcaceae bacterium]|nr:metal-sensing transcriptional repressor [Oscillospiraceae bacterium]